MLDIETLMQEWPTEFEDVLKEVCIKAQVSFRGRVLGFMVLL